MFLSEEVLWFTNFDLDLVNVVIPVDTNQLESLLAEANYDSNKT